MLAPPGKCFRLDRGRPCPYHTKTAVPSVANINWMNHDLLSDEICGKISPRGQPRFEIIILTPLVMWFSDIPGSESESESDSKTSDGERPPR